MTTPPINLGKLPTGEELINLCLQFGYSKIATAYGRSRQIVEQTHKLALKRHYNLKRIGRVYSCLNCESKWTLTITDGKVAEGWWRCPNGCNDMAHYTMPSAKELQHQRTAELNQLKKKRTKLLAIKNSTFDALVKAKKDRTSQNLPNDYLIPYLEDSSKAVKDYDAFKDSYSVMAGEIWTKYDLAIAKASKRR